MTLCPIALAAGCRSCPAVGVCPLKRVLGDYSDPEDTKPNPDGKNTQSATKHQR